MTRQLVKRPAVRLCVALAVCAALVGLCGTAYAQYYAPTLTVSEKIQLPDAPNVQVVYQLMPQLTTPEAAMDRAKLFGLKDEALGQLAGGQNELRASDGNWDY